MVEILLDMRRDASRAFVWFFETFFIQPAAQLAATVKTSRLYARVSSFLSRHVTGAAPRKQTAVRAQQAVKSDAATSRAKKGKRGFSYGFGLEKLGLLAIKWPRESFVILLFFTLFCGFGLPKLQPHGVLSELFKSDTPIYNNYQKLGTLFPTSEYDTLVIVQGDDVMAPEKLEQLRTLHLELQFAQGVQGVLSMFTMRSEPDAKGNSKPLIPDVLPKGKKYEILKQKIFSHPLIEGRLLAKGNGGQKDIVLMMLSLKPEVIGGAGFGPVLADIRKISNDTLRGLTATVDFPDDAEAAPSVGGARGKAHALPNEEFPSDEEMERLEKELPVDEAPSPGVPIPSRLSRMSCRRAKNTKS